MVVRLICFLQQDQAGGKEGRVRRLPIECTVVDTHPVLFSTFRAYSEQHTCHNTLVTTSLDLPLLSGGCWVTCVLTRAGTKEFLHACGKMVEQRVRSDINMNHD